MLFYVMMIERIIETETKQSKRLVTSKFYRIKSNFSKKVTLSVIIFMIIWHVSCSLVPLPSEPVKKPRRQSQLGLLSMKRMALNIDITKIWKLALWNDQDYEVEFKIQGRPCQFTFEIPYLKYRYFDKATKIWNNLTISLIILS